MAKDNGWSQNVADSENNYLPRRPDNAWDLVATSLDPAGVWHHPNDDDEFEPRDRNFSRDPGKIQSAINLARAMGQDTGALLRRLRALGYSDNPQMGMDFSGSDFSGARASGLRGLMSLSRVRRLNAAEEGDDQLIRPGVFQNRLDQLRSENELRESKAEWEQYGAPAFDKAQAGIDKMVNDPTFSASYIQDARSNIARIIRGNEENRLKQLSAGLGMRSLDPSSPAGAALVWQAAQQADSELANSLRDFGMNVEQIEQANTERELHLQTNLAMQRLSSKQSFLKADKNRMFDLSTQLGSILEAVRAQKELSQLQAQAGREAGKTDWVGIGASVIGAVAAPFTGGLSLALPAAYAGYKANQGGAGDYPSYQSSQGMSPAGNRYHPSAY